MTLVPASSLAPGDHIGTPGGRAVVLSVVPQGPLVRLAYEDAFGPAFVFLPTGKPVRLIEACAPADR